MIKILFQGDSITSAYRKAEEPNDAFRMGNGYAFLIAARLGRDYPDHRFSFFNRGVNGNCVKRLLERWEEDAVSLAPDILSLLNGINDTLRTFSGRENECLNDEGFAATYRKLLAPLREKNPQIRFVLLEPYLLKTGKVTEEWVKHLAPRQRIVREVAEEFDAIFIPLQTIFAEAMRAAPAEYCAWDGIHATSAGFQLIADAWLKAVGPHLATDQ